MGCSGIQILFGRRIALPNTLCKAFCYILEYDIVMNMNGSTVMTCKKKVWLSEDFGVAQSQGFDAEGNETSFTWFVLY